MAKTDQKIPAGTCLTANRGPCWFPGQYEIEATGAQNCVCRPEPSGQPCVIPPENIKDVTIGRDNWQRPNAIARRTGRLHRRSDCAAGWWASYPPHRRLRGSEVDMGIYCFRFDRPKGFGIQKMRRSLDRRN